LIIDERTDEFALAAITYEMLAGAPIFGGDSAPAILYQVVHEDPRPLQDLAPKVGPALALVVAKALSKSQGERYPTVLDFQRELERAAGSASVSPTVNLETQQVPLPPTMLQASPPTTLQLATGTTTGPSAQAVPARRGWAWAVLGGAAAMGVLAYALSGSLGRQPAERDAGPPDADRSKPDVAEPKQAIVEVEKAPPGLEVAVDGVASRLPIVLATGPETHVLRFTAPGYQPLEVQVDGRRERQTLVLSMHARPDGKAMQQNARSTKSGRRAHGKWTVPTSEPTDDGTTIW
jgi:hypothetical protein